MVVAMLRLDLLLAVNALEVESYSQGQYNYSIALDLGSNHVQVLNRLIRIVHLTNVNCNTQVDRLYTVMISY